MKHQIAALLLFACIAKADTARDKSWKNLRSAIKGSRDTVATRDGRCATGRLGKFDKAAVTVDSVKMKRDTVLRIGDGDSVDDHDPIYSGRSSWTDLRNSKPNEVEHIELEMRKGKKKECRHFDSTDDEADCDGTRIPKSDIARGYYVRLAPATEYEHHMVREGVSFLAPRTWFDYALFPRIKVLVYDATLPEENTPVSCPR